jgi:CHAT domain-containing protein
VPTPKGLNVNKHSIDIINKIQKVIHFNKKSYNQKKSDLFIKLNKLFRRNDMTQYFEKRMITLLLKGLVIICLFGNGLMAYADEPDNSGTFPSSADMLQSLEEKRIIMLNWLNSLDKKHLLLIKNWLLRSASPREDFCMMQYLQAHDRLKVSDFNGSLSLFQKILTGGCPKKVVTMAKDNICLTPLRQLDQQVLKADDFTDGLPFYQQVLKGDCPKELVRYVQEKFCLVLLLFYLEYEQVKANDLDEFLTATQPYQPMVAEHCPTVEILAKKQLLERCLIQYEQASEKEKAGQFTQALQLYQQIQEGACQNTRINELAEGNRCLIHYQQIREQTEALNFPEVSQLVELKKACQNIELLSESSLLMIVKMGAVYENQQRFAQAKTVYQKVLLIAKNLFGQAHELVSIILHRLASLSFRLAEYDEAQQRWSEQLAIEEKIYGLEPGANTLISDLTPGLKQTRIANTLIELAKVDKMLGNYVAAESRLKRALAIYETYRSEQLNVYGLMDNLATLYLELGDFTQLESLLTDIIETCEKKASSEQRQCALLRESLWTSSHMRGDYADAQSMLKEIRRLKEKLYGSDHSSMGPTLRDLAIFYSSLGDYARAESLLKRVLAIREKSYSAEHPDIAEIQSNLATIVYTDTDYEQAKSLLLTKVLTTYKKVYGSQHTTVADTLEGLAQVYLREGDYGAAKRHYQRAIAIYKAVYNPQHPKVADAIVGLANVYQIVGDEAYSQFNSEFAQPGFNEKQAAKQALAISLVEHAWAAFLFERALTIYKKVYGPQHIKVARTLSYLSLASQKGFADYGAQALPVIINDTERPEYVLYALVNLSVLLAKQNHRAAAIFFGKQMVNFLKKLQSQMPLDKTLQRAFIKDKTTYFKVLIHLLIEQNRLPEALQVIQMFKEEEYFDFVGRDTAADGRITQASYTDLEQDWANRYAQMNQQLATLANEKRDLERKAKRGDLTEAEKGRVAELEQAMTETGTTFLEELKTAFKQAEETNLAAVRKTPSQAQDNLTDLQGILRELGHGAVLVYYLILEDQLMIMLITPDKQIVRPVAINQKELSEKLSGFIATLQDVDEEEQVLQEEGLPLYELLIKPIEEELAQTQAKTLMVSLDGPLRYLPIAALHDGEQYLVERYATVMYTQAAKKTLQAPPKPVSQWKVAGFGLNDSSLPATEIELENIVCHDKNDPNGILPGVIYLNDNFTQQNLQNVLKEKYPLLHIASHFTWNLGTYLLSYLSLGDGSALTLADIRENYHFKDIDLLTLSACQTSVGYNNPATGREIEGLGILVQDKGANGIIATLWNVDADGATSEFMLGFYRLLTTGLSKAEALQKTQQDFIKEYAHPYYWAPFILMGNWLNASEPPKSLNLCSNK